MTRPDLCLGTHAQTRLCTPKLCVCMCVCGVSSHAVPRATVVCVCVLCHPMRCQWPMHRSPFIAVRLRLSTAHPQHQAPHATTYIPDAAGVALHRGQAQVALQPQVRHAARKARSPRSPGRDARLHKRQRPAFRKCGAGKLSRTWRRVV